MKSNRQDIRNALTQRLIGFDRENGADSSVVAGVDEAGRGPLAGPVVAAAVCFDYCQPIPAVNDSKKLSAQRRSLLYQEILGSACAWGVGVVAPEVIDRINILQATFVAMHKAVETLECSWNLLFVDGNRMIPNIEPDRQRIVVGGDAKSAAIAAASIVAKVTRDRIMVEYDTLYPQYGFSRHKGYGTKSHCDSIKLNGLTPVHRKSFCNNLVMQTELQFN